MKAYHSLTGLLLLVSQLVYSQKTVFNAHDPVKSRGSDFRVDIYQPVISKWLESLEQAKTLPEKATHLFFISRVYANKLKIDSALYYADKIKEIGAGNDDCMAKYYLATAHALFFRSKKREPGSLEKAITTFEKEGDNLFLGFAWRQMAREKDNEQGYPNSRLYIRRALHYFTAAGLPQEVQRSYYELGRSYFMNYQIDSSAIYLVEALKRAEELKDPNKIFTSSGFLGELYIISRDSESAEKYLAYALSNRTPQTSKVEARSRLGSYASILMASGKFDKALPVMKEYEEINNVLGDEYGKVMLNKIKGQYQMDKGNYKSAMEHFQYCLEHKSALSAFAHDTKNIYYLAGMAEYGNGNYDKTIRYFHEVIDISNGLKFGGDIMDASQYIAQSYEKKGMMDSAYHFFRQYHHLKDSVSTVEKEKVVIEMTTRYESQKKEQQIQLLEKEKDLYGFQLRLKSEQIEKQNLLNSKRVQEMALLSQQNEIGKLEASRKSLALENQEKEIGKKQNELVLLAKENELQTAIVRTESQRRKFAYMAIAGILLFSAFVYYRSNQNKRLSRRLAASLVELKQAQDQLIRTEKEKEAENIRVRISRDIHDEVGATLSGVALFSEIAKQKMEQRQDDDAQIYLQHITDNSKEMVEKMSDIVWAINPQNDSFDRIIAKLESYAFNLCAGKSIRLHLDIDDSIRSYQPGMKVRKNIYMLMKEAINNAVKYSASRNIYFTLKNNNGSIVAELKDDGKGFDTRHPKEGNGLNNMKARAAELNARLDIRSANGEGTCVRLEFDFHPAGGHLEVV